MLIKIVVATHFHDKISTSVLADTSPGFHNKRVSRCCFLHFIVPLSIDYASKPKFSFTKNEQTIIEKK